jgi:UDP-GlcNAc:undecaprenyl-phosphate GlcNAc-1-phosphate transferase
MVSFDLHWMLNAGIFLFAALVSYVMAAVLVHVSHRFDLLDYPTERKAHAMPTPFLGGAAVFLSFWSVVLVGVVIAWFSQQTGRSFGPYQPILSGVYFLTPKIGGLFLGGALIWLVGILDDKFHWPPIKKFLGQSAAALILISLGLGINLFWDVEALNVAFTFVWIMLILNAFNFIDSLDGHCSGIALISSVCFFAITQIIHQSLVGFFLIAFAGALVGFIPHNFKPAKMFLGDNGSLFVGYLMAAFTLLCNYQVGRDSTYATTFIPILIFGVPIYDTLSVILVRLIRGVPPWQGDRNHFAHRLVKIGMSDKVAVIFSYFIQSTTGLVAVLMTQVTLLGAVLIGFVFVLIIGVVAFLEFYTTEKIRAMEKLMDKKKKTQERGVI